MHNQNIDGDTLRYPIKAWLIPVIFTPILFFLSKMIFEDGDEQQFMGGKYWYIFFGISHIWRGFIISSPSLFVNLLLYRKLKKVGAPSNIIRFVIALSLILTAFVITYLFTPFPLEYFIYYTSLIILSSMLTNIHSG